MDIQLAQLAAIALKERETARRMTEDALIRERRSEAAVRVILGQMRIHHIDPDYPCDVSGCGIST